MRPWSSNRTWEELAADSCASGSPEVQVREDEGSHFPLNHTSRAGLVPKPDSSPEFSHMSLGFLMAFLMILEPHLVDWHRQAQGLGYSGLVPMMSSPCVDDIIELANSPTRMKTALVLVLGLRLEVQFSL